MARLQESGVTSYRRLDPRADGAPGRRRRSVLASAGAVAVLIIAAGLASPLGPLRGAGPDRPPATRSPTRAPGADLDAATGIVDAPGSRLQAAAVSPDDPARRLSVWRDCDASCGHATWAAAVTADGFGTRQVLTEVFTEPPTVLPAGSGFLLSWFDRRQPWLLVQPDGRSAVVGVPSDGPVAPLAADEVLATAVRGDGTVYAGLDPATGTAHPLPVPAGTEQLVRTTGGELTGLAWGDEGTATYLWSDDGGAHWHRAEVPAVGSQPGFRPLLLPWDVPAGAHAVVATSDGATLAPLVAALRLDPSGPGWSTYPAATGPTAYVGATAVLADGRLVSFVDGWSDARQGRAPTPNGLYTSRGEDWSGLQPVAQGTPFDHAPIGSDPTPLALRVSPDGLWVLRAAADGRTAYSSEDLGRSWTEVAMR